MGLDTSDLDYEMSEIESENFDVEGY